METWLSKIPCFTNRRYTWVTSLLWGCCYLNRFVSGTNSMMSSVSKKKNNNMNSFFTYSILWKLFDLYGLEIFHLQKPTQTNKLSRKFSWHLWYSTRASIATNDINHFIVDCHDKFSTIKETLSISKNPESDAIEIGRFLFFNL